ncbi:MAG: EamA family transporter [Dysgonomonas sp.]
MFTGLVSVFYYMCVNLLPASIAIILLMQYLWISIIIELLVFKKKPGKIQLIAAAIVLVGTIFAGGVFNDTITLNLKGVLFGFLAATCYAIFLITSGRIGNDLPVFKKSALMITGSCAMIFIIFPPMFFFNGVFIEGLYKWGLILALLGTVIPPMFFSYGVPKVGVSIGSILSAAELPTAVVVSHIFLSEPVDMLQWFGVLLILASIAMTNVKFGKKKKLTD